MSGTCSLLTECRALLNTSTTECFQRYSEQNSFLSLEDAFIQELSGEEFVSKGRHRHQLLIELLEGGVFKWSRGFTQIVLHDAMIEALLPHIYGDDWESEQQRVMDELGIRKIRKEVLVSMPRRHGKTVGIAMMLAIFLIVVPDVSVCVFSTGKRASGSFKEEIMRQLDCINRSGVVPVNIIRSSVERLEIAHEGGSPSVGKFFPASAKGKLLSILCLNHDR